MMEALEERQFLSVAAPTLRVAAPVITSPIRTMVSFKKASAVRQAAPAAFASPYLGTYQGIYQDATGMHRGAFSIQVTSQDSTAAGCYFGYFGFEGERNRVQIRIAADGQFKIMFFNVKTSVQISGRIDLASGRVTGSFQGHDRYGMVRGNITLQRVEPSVGR